MSAKVIMDASQNFANAFAYFVICIGYVTDQSIHRSGSVEQNS